MRRVQTTLSASQRMKFSDECKQDESHTSHHPQRDLAAGVPGIERASEGHGHRQAEEEGDENDGPDPIQLRQLLEEGCSSIEVNAGQQQELCRGEDSTNDELM